MSKATKIWLLIAASLVLIGCLIFGGAMAVCNWDFSKLSTVNLETNHYELNEEFTNISIITDTADVVLVPSENSKGSVVCHEPKKVKHSVTVKDGTLVIEVVDTRKWYEHIGIFFGSPKVTVSIPQGGYGALSVRSSTGDVKIPKEFEFESIDVSENTGNVTCMASASGKIKIKTDTGNIRVENISADALDLSVTTGNVTVSDVVCQADIDINVSTGRTRMADTRCKNLISGGSTGDISLKNVTASEKLSIERSTGDVEFDGADAAEIFVETDTGDIEGTLLSEKVFIVETDTGRIDVPKTVSGGRCELTSDTGDIRIKLQQ